MGNWLLAFTSYDRSVIQSLYYGAFTISNDCWDEVWNGGEVESSKKLAIKVVQEDRNWHERLQMMMAEIWLAKWFLICFKALQ